MTKVSGKGWLDDISEIIPFHLYVNLAASVRQYISEESQRTITDLTTTIKTKVNHSYANTGQSVQKLATDHHRILLIAHTVLLKTPCRGHVNCTVPKALLEEI